MTLSAETFALLAIVGLVAGVLGSLVGIGGGVLLVPALVVGFRFPVHDAVAVSLVSVVATSTAAGSLYVGAGLANMRLGMTLEIATTLGGMAGGLAATAIAPRVLGGLFAIMLVVTAVLLLRGRDDAHAPSGGGHPDAGARGWEDRGRLGGAYRDAALGRLVRYGAERVGLGSAVAFFAGAMSGLLGVGGGFLKVPAMTLGMRVPLRVAAATSNFMIGVTAIASLSIYLARGYVRPLLAAPIVLGVVVGSLAGASVSHRVAARWLRIVLAIVLGAVAVEMGLRAFGGVDVD